LQEKRQRQPGWRPPDKGERNGAPDGKGPQEQRGSDDPGRVPPNRPPRPPRGSGGDPLQFLRGLRLPGGRWWLPALALLWILSGIYIVQPDEAGVVLRFGRYVRTVPPGPHYHLPYPVETVYRPKVSYVRQAEVGYFSQSTGTSFQQGRIQPVDEESSMLTMDENIISVQFTIQFNIKPDDQSPVDYLFNVTQPDAVVKKAAEAVMREIIGRTRLDDALAERRASIQDMVATDLQKILDFYQVGVRVIAVQMQDVQPPREVSDAFKDVASAREDKQRLTNQAEAYSRDLLPKAQGLAAEMVNQAEAYRQARVQQAQGEAQRFLSVLAEYRQAPELMKTRMVYEALEEIISRPGLEKLVLPEGMGLNALPLLPLDSRGGQRPAVSGGAREEER
jgi:membrane protease subunit HflK